MVAFNYYEAYRTESSLGGPVLSFPALRGASHVVGRTWVFFGSDRDAYSIFMPSFEVARATLVSDGVIEAAIDTGNPQPILVRFIPLTASYVRAHPDQYPWLSAEVLLLLDEPGMMSLLFVGSIPEWYVERFAPVEELESDLSA